MLEALTLLTYIPGADDAGHHCTKLEAVAPLFNGGELLEASLSQTE